MKSIFSFVVFVCFAQICLSAPAGYLSDSRIDEIRSNLNEINGLSTKCIDKLMEVFQRFRIEATQKQTIGATLDLIGLTLQSPACDNAKIDFRNVIESIENDGVTDDQMIKTENQLCQLVPARRVQQAVIILNAFRAGATNEEHENAILDFVLSTIQTLKTLCSSNGTTTEV